MKRLIPDNKGGVGVLFAVILFIICVFVAVKYSLLFFSDRPLSAVNEQELRIRKQKEEELLKKRSGPTLNNIGQEQAPQAPKLEDKYAEMDKLPPDAQEQLDKINIQQIRIAISVYYNEKNAHYPSGIMDLVPQYLHEIPPCSIPGVVKATNTAVNIFGLDQIGNTGGWAYDNNPKSRTFGSVFINYSGQDSAGKFWTKY